MITYRGSILWLMLFGMSINTPLIAAEADDMATHMLVDTCIACHGPAGSSYGPAIPTIGGMSQDSFLYAMEMYQTGERKGTVMNRIAKGYTEADLEVMANYFVKQSFMRFPQEFDAAKAEVGAQLHEEYCETCHVDNGFTDEDGSSILAGQWLPYLEFNLVDFWTDKRDMPKKMRKGMEDMVEEHGEASLEQVAHFYASQVKKP